MDRLMYGYTAECAFSPSWFPRGTFSNFLACIGILHLVTPHRLALCPPLGQIVIFIYQLIATLPALSPPSQETHVADENRKTIPSLNASISLTL